MHGDTVITSIEASDNIELNQEGGQLLISSSLLVEGEAVKKVYQDAGIKFLIEDGELTISQDVTVDPWPYQVLTVFDTVYTVNKNEQMGVDYIVDYDNKDIGLLSMKLELVEPAEPGSSGDPTPIKDGSQIRVSLDQHHCSIQRGECFWLQQLGGKAFNYNISTPTTFVLAPG